MAVAVAMLAFVIQAGVVIEFYRRAKKFMADVKPVLAKAGTASPFGVPYQRAKAVLQR